MIHLILSFIVGCLITIIGVLIIKKGLTIKERGFQQLIQYILDILYFSRNETPDKIKRRYYAPVTIGYLISAIAFIGTIISFIVSDDTQIKIFIAIVFAIILFSTITYDKLAKKTNDLIQNLNNDTKDLIYSYEELKNYEINKKYKKVFEDFTRYTSGVLGVQVYNYYLLSKRDSECIKIEYEFGSVSEGIHLNAVLQEYYEFSRESKEALLKAVKRLEQINDTNDLIQVFNYLETLKNEAIKTDYSPASIAIWLMLYEKLINIREQIGKIDNFSVEYTETTGNNENHSNTTSYKQSAATTEDLQEAEDSKDLVYKQLNDHEKSVATSVIKDNPNEEKTETKSENENLFDLKRLNINNKTGLFRSIVNSDILKLKDYSHFSYEGENNQKHGRFYLYFKANTDKGETKIFLIVMDPKDVLYSKGIPEEQVVLDKFISMLDAHGLVYSSTDSFPEGGIVYESAKRFR